ncbi:MAG: hypothetical protein L0Y64_02290 [Myxococcaceae bacterium]|nr:hypothetical protein [Myxococcaceae bacterium]
MALALAGAAALAAPPSTPHLRAGAEHFRSGRFEEALVEFRVSDTLGEATDASWYVAATLTKLGRAEEAHEAFAQAERRSPGGRDALLDFYRALACHQLRLYTCADAALVAAGTRAGPTVAGHAAKMRAELMTVLRAEPSRATVDWYFERAREAEARSQLALAAAYRREAAALARRRQDCYRCDGTASAVHTSQAP